jgi:hypothetical protein
MPVNGEAADEDERPERGAAGMENDELMAGIAEIGDVRQVRRQVLGFVLSRGSIGEIECDGSSDREDQGSDKSGGKAQWFNVAVV